MKGKSEKEKQMECTCTQLQAEQGKGRGKGKGKEAASRHGSAHLHGKQICRAHSVEVRTCVIVSSSVARARADLAGEGMSVDVGPPIRMLGLSD